MFCGNFFLKRVTPKTAFSILALFSTMDLWEFLKLCFQTNIIPMKNIKLYLTFLSGWGRAQEHSKILKNLKNCDFAVHNLLCSVLCFIKCSIPVTLTAYKDNSSSSLSHSLSKSSLLFSVNNVNGINSVHRGLRECFLRISFYLTWAFIIKITSVLGLNDKCPAVPIVFPTGWQASLFMPSICHNAHNKIILQSS